MPRRFTLERVLNRLSRELVSRFGFHPAWCGYRYLNLEVPENATLIHAGTVSEVPLPCNITSRAELSRDRHIAGFSFYDVPHRLVEPTYVATLRNCRILTQTDAWGDSHYAVVSPAQREVGVRGTGFQRQFHASLMRQESEWLPKATWILEAWDRNYAHWLQWHLTKIALLQKRGLAQNVLLPPLRGFVAASVAMLGLDSYTQIPGSVVHVDELNVVGMDHYRASLLRDLRDRMVGAAPLPKRGLFISRRSATRRRLMEEDRCWDMLRARGYERVFMEDLSFAEQVALMSEAKVVVGLHGAGLANILFAPAGAHVIEIADVTFPNPQFYALAGALGHHYWLLHAQPVGELNPGYHDLTLNVARLESVLDSVAALLN
jgi:capsular polysaccharide biosynthesis protein